MERSADDLYCWEKGTRVAGGVPVAQARAHSACRAASPVESPTGPLRMGTRRVESRPNAPGTGRSHPVRIPIRIPDGFTARIGRSRKYASRENTTAQISTLSLLQIAHTFFVGRITVGMKPVQLPASKSVSTCPTCWIDLPKQIGVHAQVPVRKRKRWQGLWLARDDTSGIIILTAGPNRFDSATVRYLHSVTSVWFSLRQTPATAPHPIQFPRLPPCAAACPSKVVEAHGPKDSRWIGARRTASPTAIRSPRAYHVPPGGSASPGHTGPLPFPYSAYRR